MNKVTLSAAIGSSATVSLLALILLLQLPAAGIIVTIASLVPFVGIYLSGDRNPGEISTNLVLSIGALIGVGFFFLLTGAYLAAIVDIGYGIYWISRIFPDAE